MNVSQTLQIIHILQSMTKCENMRNVLHFRYIPFLRLTCQKARPNPSNFLLHYKFDYFKHSACSEQVYKYIGKY